MIPKIKIRIILECMLLIMVLIMISYFIAVNYVNMESETTVKADGDTYRSDLFEYMVNAKAFFKGYDKSSSVQDIVAMVKKLDSKTVDELFELFYEKVSQDEEFLKYSFFVLRDYLFS